MIWLLSPAMNLKREPAFLPEGISCTKPVFQQDANQIAAVLRGFQPYELETILKANPEIAMRAFADYQQFSEGGQPCLLEYQGLVFRGLRAETLGTDDLLFAQTNLRMLSALYGVLRPLDAIRPYRLEMQNKLKLQGENLYVFWGSRLYETISGEDRVILNLASEEYAKCIRKYAAPPVEFIDVRFLAARQGKLKNVTAWTKLARGNLVRWLIQGRVSGPEALVHFAWGGYQYAPKLSSASCYTFLLQGDLQETQIIP